MRDAEARSTGRGGARLHPGCARVRGCRRRRVSHPQCGAERQRGSPRPERRRPTQRLAGTALNGRRARPCALAPAPRPAVATPPARLPAGVRLRPRPRRAPARRAPRPPGTPRRPARLQRPWSRPAGLYDPCSGTVLLRCRRLPPWTSTPGTGGGCPARGLPAAPAAGGPPSGTRGRGCRGRAGGPAGDCGVVGVRPPPQSPGCGRAWLPCGWLFPKRPSEERFPRNRVLGRTSHNGSLWGPQRDIPPHRTSPPAGFFCRESASCLRCGWATCLPVGYCPQKPLATPPTHTHTVTPCIGTPSGFPWKRLMYDALNRKSPLVLSPLTEAPLNKEDRLPAGSQPLTASSLGRVSSPPPAPVSSRRSRTPQWGAPAGGGRGCVSGRSCGAQEGRRTGWIGKRGSGTPKSGVGGEGLAPEPRDSTPECLAFGEGPAPSGERTVCFPFLLLVPLGSL